MSESESAGDVSLERSPEEKLKALIRKDIDPEITKMAKRALARRQEESV